MYTVIKVTLQICSVGLLDLGGNLNAIFLIKTNKHTKNIGFPVLVFRDAQKFWIYRSMYI